MIRGVRTSPFIQGVFFAEKGGVAGEEAINAAVVTDRNNQGVVVRAAGFQAIEYAPYIVIKLMY